MQYAFSCRLTVVSINMNECHLESWALFNVYAVLLNLLKAGSIYAAVDSFVVGYRVAIIVVRLVSLFLRPLRAVLTEWMGSQEYL
jgi:hypothetical protein